MQIVLQRPTTTHISSLQHYISLCLPAPDGIHGSSMITSYSQLEAWIHQCELDRSEKTVQAGWVPAEQYVAIDVATGEVVGLANLRKSLNDMLLNYFGHIGYSVRPDLQGQGIATTILALLLDEARTIELERVLLACYEDNIASRRVIEKNDGVLEDLRLDPDDTVYTCRYWIRL